MQISLFHDKNKFEEAITEQLLKEWNSSRYNPIINKFLS